MTDEIRTVFDHICEWNCCECSFTTGMMFKAETHQAETDHCMERKILDKAAFDRIGRT